MIESKDVPKIVISLVLTVVAVFLIWKLVSVLLLILMALMLAAALNPIVDRLSTKMPRSAASITVILIFIVPLIAIFISILPGLFKQIPEIISSVNSAFHNSTFLPHLQNIDLTAYTEKSGEYLLQSSGKLTGFLGSIITVLVLTVYLLIDGKSLRRLFLGLLPKGNQEKVATFLEDLYQICGHYIRGNLLISLICSLVIFIGLLSLGVPYAAALAALAGIMDLLPLVGALIGAILPVILGFTISSTIGVLVILLFIIYQQIENYFLSPKIYNKTLDLSPTLIIISVIIGGSLYGVTGAFISLPIAASVPAVIKYFENK